MKLYPFLDQGLPRLVRRMGLAGDDELHRALRIGQKTQQALRIVQQQVRSLVGREAARKTQCQRVGIEQMLRPVNRLGRRAGGGQLPGQSFASVFNKRRAGGSAKLPEPGVGDAANVLLQGFRRPQPAVLAAGLRPKIVGRGRVPGRHVDAVGHVSDRHFVLPASAERAARKSCRLTFPCKRLTPLTAPLPRIARYAMLKLSDESFGFWRPSASKSWSVMPSFCSRITTEVLLDEGRSETVKAGGHRRVGGEEVARSRDGQRDFEGLPGRLHETPRAFQHGEGRMPFIQVADFRLDAERGKQPPSADPEQQFLLEAQLRPAAIKLAGNPSMRGEVRRVIAVQQVKLHSADLNLPGAQPDRVTGQGDLQPQPLAVRLGATA